MSDPKEPEWLSRLLSTEAPKTEAKKGGDDCAGVHSTCALASLMAIVVAIWDDEVSDNPQTDDNGNFPTRAEFGTMMALLVEGARPFLKDRKEVEMNLMTIFEFIKKLKAEA